MLIGIPLALILAQPNLSTTIVLALVFAAMLFAAGLSYKIVVGVLAVCVPTFFIVLTLIIQDKFPFIHSYQLGRIMDGFIRINIRILPTSSRTLSWRSVPAFCGEKDSAIPILPP